MDFLTALKSEATTGVTENGAKTFTSTLNKNLDFFAMAGAMRGSEPTRIQNLFEEAYYEDRDIALRNLVHLRNIRMGGLGERYTTHESLRRLLHLDEAVAVQMVPHLPVIGSWKDLVEFFDYAESHNFKKAAAAAANLIAAQLGADLTALDNGEQASLCAKWVPSTNVKSKRRRHTALVLSKALGFQNEAKLYNSMLTALRTYLDVVEKKMAAGEFDKINFEKLPSKALFKYRAAWARRTPETYSKYLAAVESGEAKMNVKNVLPYEIVRAYLDGSYGSSLRTGDKPLELAWKNLDNVLEGVTDNILVMADVSGSMTGDPMNVSVSLAIYTAERLKGCFHNTFLTFSERPSLVQLKDGATLADNIRATMRADWGMNTDLQAAMKLILDSAVNNNLPQSELPSTLLIVSDMEFDSCVSRRTNFEAAKEMFEAAGYTMPKIVFWNVAARQNNVPVRHNEKGVALVSGLTPNIFKSVLIEGDFTPETVMMQTLLKPEYDFVTRLLV